MAVVSCLTFINHENSACMQMLCVESVIGGGGVPEKTWLKEGRVTRSQIGCFMS